MRLFGGRGDDDAAEAQALEAQEALARGDILPKARQRLQELAAGGSGFFTSDLTVDEHALLHQAGIRPLSQVMGSSIYHVGWQWTPGSWGRSQELEVVSHAWNEARRLALRRLYQEARACGADAVVAVRIQTGYHDWAADAIEFVAVGTAVRLPERLEKPVLTDLSGDDFWKLHRAGYRPLGVVGATTVYYVVASWRTQRAQGGWSSWANQELSDFTQGVYDARELALSRVSAQAAERGASGVVGVTIDESARRREVDSGGTQRTDLVVTFHVLGTAIAEPPDGPARELPVTPVVSRGG
jgi:uncharacterized protein YbjQ (UPF0145 family)